MLPLSQHQNDWNSTQEQCAKCKRSFRTSQLLNLDTHLAKKSKQSIQKLLTQNLQMSFPLQMSLSSSPDGYKALVVLATLLLQKTSKIER